MWRARRMRSGEVGSGSRERGANALEFALLAPVLILFLLGIIEFGRGYNAKITVTHAAREAVRQYYFGGDPQTEAQQAAGGLAVSASGSGGPCNSSDPPHDVSVTVNHDFTYDIAFFGSATINLSETATMWCRGSG